MAKYKQGQSGNPRGRPKGSRDKRTAIRSLLEPHSEKLVNTVIARALDGDIAALKLCFDRLMPPLRAKDEKVNLPGLGSAATLTEQGEAILKALADGGITPIEASSLMSTISTLAKIIEIDELERRVTEIENRITPHG